MAKISEKLKASDPSFLDNPLMSGFGSAFTKLPSRSYSLRTLIERIRSDERLIKDTASIRSLLERGRDRDFKAAKLQIATALITGLCKTRSADATLEDRFITYSGFLLADFDGKDHPHLLDPEAQDPAARTRPLMDLLRADPHVQAAFVSISGQGVKAIVRTVCTHATDHRAAFEGVASHFASAGLIVDAATKDIGRLCGLAHDPAAWLAPTLTAALRLAVIPPRSPRVDYEPLSTTTEDIREMLRFIEPRPAYEDWIRIASAVWSVLDDRLGATILDEWSPEEVPGEYLRKYKTRLKEVRVGTLAWYAQAGGFDAAEAARRRRWTGRIRFAQKKNREIAVAPDHADGLVKTTECNGEEECENPLFVDWCFQNQQRGDAELWRAIVSGQRLYDHLAQCWRSWTGSVWIKDDTTLSLINFMDDLSQIYKKQLALLQTEIAASCQVKKDDPRLLEKKELTTRIRSINSLRWAEQSLKIAQSHPRLSTMANRFDRSRGLLALKNGVLDFEASEFRESHMSDMITRQALVHFDPDATCPIFDAFLLRTLVDSEVIAFILRAMAYSLTGFVDEDVLFFCYGKGSNGKSTFMMIFKMLLGELMTSVDIESLLARKADANLDYKKSMLEGCRVAVTDEIPENRKLSESMIKALIGGDDIVARKPYEIPYTFSPTHKLWMVGNHKPVIEGTDMGIWRRICLIPWTQTIPAAERKPRGQLTEELRAELPGILNRLLIAWEEFRAMGGLKPPTVVQDATAEYREDQDLLGNFLADRTENDLESTVQSTRLLKTYLAWCEDNGERSTTSSSRQLIAKLKERGYTTKRTTGNNTYIVGLSLLELLD